MKKNPIIPFILIMGFGLGLIFFLSIGGVGEKKDIAAGKEGGDKTEQTAGGDAASFDAEAVASAKCATCHGQDLKGMGSFPNLVETKLDQKGIAEVIKNGRGAMPPGLVPDADIDKMAEYIFSLK